MFRPLCLSGFVQSKLAMNDRYMILACYNETLILVIFWYLQLNFSKIVIFRHFEKIVKLAFFKFECIRIAMTECFNSFSVGTMIPWKHNIQTL